MGLGRAEEEVAGLQALLTPASGLDEHERRSSRTRALQAIFDISNDDPNGALVQSDGLDLVALGRAMSARVAVVADTAAAAAAPPGDSSTAPPLEQAMAAGDSMETGRLGPPDVSVDRASTCGSFAFRGRDGLALEALSNFSSARANVAVFKGRWMYEATVHTPGIQQIGWATLHCPFTTEEGVGDAPDSYAVDGKRQRKWSVKPQPYGEHWAQGDVMGCAIDLDGQQGTITFFRNGRSLGVAFDRVRTLQPSLAYFPAFSLSHAERCTLNFGSRPFMHPIDGYAPLQCPPPPGVTAAAHYYSAVAARLAWLAGSAELPDTAAAGGSTGGSGAAAAVTATSKAAAPDSPSAVFRSAAAVAAAVPHGVCTLAGSIAGDGVAPGSAAVVAAGRRLSLGRAPVCLAAGAAPAAWTGWLAGEVPDAASLGLDGDDLLLLSAVVLGPLGEVLCQQPYLLHSVLLPQLAELHGGAEDGLPRPLRALLRSAALVWGEREYARVMLELLSELAFRAQVSPLLVTDAPDTAGLPHLSLAVALLHDSRVMRALLADSDYVPLVEALLTRKAPSGRDLTALLPHVWWRGCRDETASEERLRAGVGAITATLAKVEQRQYELALLLLVTPFQEELPSGNSGSAGKGSSSDDGDNCALLVFLRTLLLRNRAALRDVPPPGLSDPTVLMSAFFCVLRLLTPALEDAMMRQSGPLAAFPAARLLASTGTSAADDAPPLDDAPRLGGVLSHLAREHPLRGPELQPLGPPALPAAAVGGTPAAAWPPGLQAAWVPELLCVASLLYSWRVGHSLRMVSSLAASVDASSAALAQLEHMAAAAGDAGAEEASHWLQSMRVYREEVTRDVRLLTLLRAVLFSPAKQAALAGLAGYLAGLLEAAGGLHLPPQQQQQQQQQQEEEELGAQACHAPAMESAAAQRLQDGGCSSTGRADQAEEQQLSSLLRYMPTSFAELVLDYLAALRRLDEQQSLHVGCGSAAEPASGRAVVSWLCGTLSDERIANPDVQEQLLQVTGLLLEDAAWRALVEARLPHAQQLLCSLLQAFDSRLWHPASGVLLKVVRGRGFGLAPSEPPLPGSLPALLLQLMGGAASSSSSSSSASSLPDPPHKEGGDEATCRGRGASAPAAVAAGFINRLLSTLTWALTEFTVSVGELHSQRGRRSILEAQSQSRRAGLMFELSVGFCRLLEFVLPTPAFLGSAVNRDRLRELLRFVLVHFTNGPDARRLNDLLQAGQSQQRRLSSSGGGGMSSASAAAAGNTPAAMMMMMPRTQPLGPPAAPLLVPLPAGGGAAAPLALAEPAMLRVDAAADRLAEAGRLGERVSKPALLAPVMGMLLGLWEAHCAGAAGAVGAAGAPVHQDDLLQELAQLADPQMMAALAFMQGLDWSAAFPGVPLSAQLRAYAQLLHALPEARVTHEAMALGTDGRLPEDTPDEFTDPITMDIMRDPVRLPDSQIVLDRSTIERHLLSSATDPFSRAPLAADALLPEEQLRQQIADWLAQRRVHQAAAARAAESGAQGTAS